MPNDRYHDSLPPRPRRDDDYDDERPLRRVRSAGYYRPNEDECTSGMLCHLLAIFMHFLGPIIIWAMKKQESRFVDYHGREALNFSINMALYAILATVIVTVVTIVTCGIGAVLFPLVLVVSVYSLVMHIIALTAANRGEWYRYPMIFRIIPPPEGMEDYEPVGSHDDGDYSPEEEPTRERKPMLWVWLLCGTAALLLGGCCIGGIVYAVIEQQRQTEKAYKEAEAADQPRLERMRPNGGGPFVDDVRANPDGAAPGAQPGGPPVVAPPRRGPERLDPPEQPGDPVEQAIARLKSTRLADRQRAADTLAKSGDKRASKALAEALKDPGLRRIATDALKQFGPAAEDDVLPILNESHFAIKQAAIEVLHSIGTKKSLEALEPLTKDRSRFVSGPARDAIIAIKGRTK